MPDEVFKDGEIISAYTSAQAVADGILVDIREVNPQWERGIFSHVTTNLLATCGYYKEDRTLNIPNLLDLLNQSLQIVKRESDNFQKADWFFSGSVELPSGEQQKVFIEQNELSKYTIMLPEDH